MATASRLNIEQRRVAVGMAAAMLIVLAVLGAGVPLLGHLAPTLPGTADRLAFALRCQLFVTLALGARIAAVAAGRFVSPTDIAGAAFVPPSARLSVPVAVLQNTLEQVTLAMPVHLGLATLLVGPELVLLPLLTALFCFGWVLFALGYRHGAGGRALGLGLTFYPTLAALGLALVLLAAGR